ncbi:hypothetical protein MHU86_12951 [Fragilaria crotonensis]|nr:hypothetical protein MHU86_12951 [Fragilaria crotonensis]
MSGSQRKDGSSPLRHNPSVIVNNESSSNIVRKRKAGGAAHMKPLEYDVDRSSKHGKVGTGGSVPFKEQPLVLFGGRTLPGETARNLIAGSSNPRVFGDLEGKAPGGDPMSRKAWHPSKTQFANVIAKCLPRTDINRFHQTWKTVLSAMKGKPVPDDPVFGIPGSAQLLNTNVQVIHRTFLEMYGLTNVSLAMRDHMNDGVDIHSVVTRPDYLEIVMMDAVIARTVRIPRRRTEAGVYYCHREKRHESVGVPNTHIPMDMNWLRIVRNGSRINRFAKGGYVSRLWDGNVDKIWKWRISRGSSNFLLDSDAMGITSRLLPFPKAMKKVMYARQCPDEEGPRLAPDHVEGQDYAMVEGRYLRRAYNAGLEASPSAKRGCRHYVSGFLHRVISIRESLVIDPSDGDVDVCVSVQVNHPGSQTGKMSVSRDSVIQIRYLPTLGPAADKMLGDIRKHAQTVRSRNQNSARAGKGDLGSMHPIGTRICLDGVHRTRYVTSSEESAQSLLRDAVVASANLAAVSIPAVLRTMQDLEVDGGVIPRHGMAGDGCFANITNTMDVSVDLSNASHYDVNDASQGFSIWTEDDPGSTDDWYFVLPNVYGKRDGKGPTYNGMAIRLKHGVMISWDGRLIRHCTSMMRRAEGKHVYGTFFAAKTAIVRYGTRKAAASYQCSAKLEVGELSKRVLTLRGELDVAVASLEEAKRAVSVADRSVRDLNKLLTEAERALAIAVMMRRRTC